MQLYNVLSHEFETFVPQGDEVTIYVCGITPYDTTHLGHAFTYTTFDVLIRYLEYKGYRVRYVQNVTDIDDDILRKARAVAEDWQTLGKRWTAHYIHEPGRGSKTPLRQLGMERSWLSRLTARPLRPPRRQSWKSDADPGERIPIRVRSGIGVEPPDNNTGPRNGGRRGIRPGMGKPGPL